MVIIMEGEAGFGFMHSDHMDIIMGVIITGVIIVPAYVRIRILGQIVLSLPQFRVVVLAGPDFLQRAGHL